MPTIELVRRGTTVDNFQVKSGQPLFVELIARHIPPTSVVITRDGNPISAFTTTVDGTRYVVDLLEGYDIEQLRELHNVSTEPKAVHTSRTISFNEGDLTHTVEHFNKSEFISHVETLFQDTIDHYGLISPGDQVLIALSGESDSAATLLGLEALQSSLDIDIAAITIEEPRGNEDGAFKYASELTDELGIEHYTLDLSNLEEIYGMKDSIRTIFNRLPESRFDDRVLSVLETVHRHAFEVVAEREGFDLICTGKYLTEFVAGTINSITSGVQTRNIPKAQVGNLAYIYPAVYLDKVELALYHRFRTGTDTPTSQQNMWDTMSSDQGHMYYLADMLRSYWPGIGYWLVESQRKMAPNRSANEYHRCPSCGKYVLDKTNDKHCLACKAFETVGAL